MTSKLIELRQMMSRCIIENRSLDGSIDISDQSVMLDELIDAVIAALPAERQKEYVLDGGNILSQEGNQRFFRYGGYDSALNNVRHILEQAKELPTNKENK